MGPTTEPTPRLTSIAELLRVVPGPVNRAAEHEDLALALEAREALSHAVPLLRELAKSHLAKSHGALRSRPGETHEHQSTGGFSLCS